MNKEKTEELRQAVIAFCDIVLSQYYQDTDIKGTNVKLYTSPESITILIDSQT